MFHCDYNVEGRKDVRLDSLEAKVVEWEDEGFADVEEIVETNICSSWGGAMSHFWLSLPVGWSTMLHVQINGLHIGTKFEANFALNLMN